MRRLKNIIKAPKTFLLSGCGFLPALRYLWNKTISKGLALEELRRTKLGNTKAEHNRLVALTLAISMTSVGLLSEAQAEHYVTTQRYEFNIPAQSVADALNQFAEQTGAVLLFPFDLVEGRAANAVIGRHELTKALDILLAGSGLSGGLVHSEVIQISRDDGNTRTDRKEVTMTSAGIKKSLLAGVATALFGSGAYSQDEFSERSNSDNADTIVVTAQKRAQDIQDVPLSVTALSEDDIYKRNLVGMSDYLRTTPGVNIIDYGVGQSAIIIRGVAADPQEEGFNTGPSVGVYLGETPITGYAFGSSADIKLVDIERIEVLRGPQGTLYGSSSLGGTVKNIPNSPELNRFGGSVLVGYSSTARSGGDNSNVHGVVNVPILEDKLAFRAVGYYFQNDGYINNIAGSNADSVASAQSANAAYLAADDDNIGATDYTGFRASILFEPVDSLKLKVSYLNQSLDQNGLPESELDLGSYTQARLRLGDFFEGDERLQNDTEIISLDVNFDLPWGALTSASSWVDEKFHRNRNIGSFFGGIPFPQNLSNGANAFIQELRFSSDFDAPIQVVGGLYYENSESAFAERSFWGGDQALNPFDPTTPLLAIAEEAFSLEQKAAFGEVYLSPIERLTLTGGLRVFDYKKTDTKQRDGFFFGGPSLTMTELKDNGANFKAGVDYELTDRSLLYFSWAQGFRLGRTVPILPSICDVDMNGIIDGTNISIDHDQTRPDTLESYELGAKISTQDKRATVNASVYRSNWNGIPVNIVATCGLSTVDNAGKARVHGFELESSLRLSPQLLVEFGGSYVDAQLTEDAPGIGGQDGDRLPGSPKVSLNFGSEYLFTLLGGDAFFRADYAYVGGFYNNLKETGDVAGAYHQVNLKTGVTFDRTSIDFYVNNLTNADEIAWQDVSLTTNRRAIQLRPRTYGLNIGYRF